MAKEPAGHPELFFLDAPSQLAEGRRDDKSIWADFQFFGQLRRVEEVDIRSGFLEDSITDHWSVPEAKGSGFLEDPKKLQWQPKLGQICTQEAASWTLPEPDSEPDVSPPPLEPSLDLDQLWRSTVEALECRSTWEQRQCPVAMAGPAVRQAYLALYGMSSELFQVDETRGVVRYRGALGLLDQQMLRDWAISCSKCLRLKAVSEKLAKNSSLTSQALGGVLKELLHAFYHDLSRRVQPRPSSSFIQLHVAAHMWLRRLQPIFSLCGVDDIDKEVSAKMGSSPPLPKLPRGIELLEHIFRSCRVHEVSSCHFQACHRQLPAHLVPADMMLLWVFQRSMQPFLDCLLATMDPNATQHYVIPKEFEGGTRKIRFPGFLSSIDADMQAMSHKLSILGLHDMANASAEGVAQKFQPSAFFEMQELQCRSFLRLEHREEELMRDEGSSLAILFAVRAQARPVAPPPRRSLPLPGPTTFFELPKPEIAEAKAEPAEMHEAAKRKQQDEFRMALDAQVVEKRALKEAAKRLEMEEEAKERALLGEPDDEMLLEEFRQEILEEHEMEQRRIQEESLLLRWKVERLRSAEPLRKLYALEAENGPVEPMVISAPRRIDVEEIVSSWGPLVNPFDVVQSSPANGKDMVECQDSVGEQIVEVVPDQDDEADLQNGHSVTAEHVDPHKELVQQVLRQIYSSCARLLVSDASHATTVWHKEVEPAEVSVRPVLGSTEGYSSQISRDVMLVKFSGSRPMDAALESCLLRPLRQQSQWVDMEVVRKVLDLQLLRRIELLRRYMLMGESRLLEPFLTEVMSTYAAVRPKRPTATEVQRAESALNTLFQSMLPRPTESSDDAFLASMTLHLATVPVPIGHGPVRLLDGIRFSLNLDVPMNLFFTERIMLQYSRLFRIIGLVNHTLECLKGSWWFLASTSTSDSSGEMRRLAALRQSLHHFASTLHRYLLVGVVAAEFQRLEKKILGATSLNEILLEHRACLGRCLAKAFLDTSRLEAAGDALAAVVGILDQALQLQRLLEEVAAQAPRSFPAWAVSRVYTINGSFLDLRRSLQLCRPGGDGIDLDPFEEDFFETWLLQWSRHFEQN